MTLSLTKPVLDLIPSYLEALESGDFITMQLGHADWDAVRIAEDPAGYIAHITCPDPFMFEIRSRMFQVRRHTLLWITDGTRFLGTVALRFDADPEIMNYAGHIGLAIRPDLIGCGLGILSLRASIEEIHTLFSNEGIQNIIITCDVENTASARLITYFGGVLVSQDTHEDGQGYRFELRDTPIQPS